MPEMTHLTIAIGPGVLKALLLAGKYWSDSNNEDLGTMSEQWVAQHNASHP